MINKSIYNYLKAILNDIDIPPFKAKKLADSSVYECKALSNNSEQIKIDYDENKFTTAIEITDGKKFLNVTFIKTKKTTLGPYSNQLTNSKLIFGRFATSLLSLFQDPVQDSTLHLAIMSP